MSFSKLDAFLARHTDAFRLAISGGSRAESAQWIRAILTPLRYERIVVVTGGTDVGIAGDAARIAHRELRFPIIGVLPARGRKHQSPEFSGPDAEDGCACLVEVPPIFGESQWGDESSLFVRLADVILAFGGEWGTTVELALTLKTNAGRIVKGHPPIRIVPVHAFPGPAQRLSDVPWLTDAMRRATFPRRTLVNPHDIAGYLRTLLREERHRPS